MDSFSTIILTVLLPLAIAFVIFGLGLGLRREDFLRLVRFPKVTLIGLAIKIVVMPLTAMGLARAFGLSPAFSVGLVMVAAGPCSVMANVFTKMARANVALGLTFTAIDNFAAAVVLPAYTAFAIQYYANADGRLPVQWSDSVRIFLLMVVPVSIGMWVREKQDAFADRWEARLKKFAIILLVALIAMILGNERERLLNNLGAVGGAAFALALLGLVYGFGVGRFLGFQKNEARAIAFALPVQSTALIGTVAISVLDNIEYAIPAGIYSIFMYVVGFLGVWAFQRRG